MAHSLVSTILIAMPSFAWIGTSGGRDIRCFEYGCGRTEQRSNEGRKQHPRLRGAEYSFFYDMSVRSTRAARRSVRLQLLAWARLVQGGTLRTLTLE